jgi:hypothetical protein
MKSSSMDSWRQHIRGVAQLINVRGPEQFKSEGSLRLFLQIRRLIVGFFIRKRSARRLILETVDIIQPDV